MMEIYELSQQDIHVLEEKLREDKSILKRRDNSERLLLHWAALGGRETLVKIILNSEFSDIDLIDAADDTEATPLLLAVLGGHLAIVQELVAKGADVNIKKQGGHSPLQYAASKGYKEIFDFLLSKGADVNAKDDRLDTPLHRAAALGRIEITKLLIAKGANVNAQNRELNTPLHLALEDEQVETASILYENGADTEILNRAKQSPFDLCRPALKKKLIEKYGAEKN